MGNQQCCKKNEYINNEHKFQIQPFMLSNQHIQNKNDDNNINNNNNENNTNNIQEQFKNISTISQISQNIQNSNINDSNIITDIQNDSNNSDNNIDINNITISSYCSDQQDIKQYATEQQLIKIEQQQQRQQKQKNRRRYSNDKMKNNINKKEYENKYNSNNIYQNNYNNYNNYKCKKDNDDNINYINDSDIINNENILDNNISVRESCKIKNKIIQKYTEEIEVEEKEKVLRKIKTTEFNFLIDIQDIQQYIKKVKQIYKKDLIIEKENCQLLENNNNIQYIGIIKNGLVNSVGQIYKKDVIMYHGEIEDNDAHGIGIYIIQQQKQQYEQQQQQDEKEYVYIGNIYRGKYNGKGQLYEKIQIKQQDIKNIDIQQQNNCNIKRYDGNWQQDIPHGYGIEYMQNGDRYEGKFENGIKSGDGKLIYKNGIQYIGQFRNDKIEGEGVMKKNSKRENKKEEEIEKNIEKEEKENIEEEEYRGKWKKGKRNGKGIQKYKNGDIYEGEFRNDRREGQGIYKYKNGKSIRGIWKGGQLIQKL